MQAARALDALVGADVLRAGLPLEFVHPLLREAVYRDARPGQRALAHAAAARMLAEADQPAERVATQLLLCEPAGSEWATATRRAAGREAMGRGAPQAAARYLSRALSEPPPEDARRDLLLELGVAESRAGSAGATQTLHSALRLTRDPVARASIAEELAAILNLRGEFEEASSALDDAIRALPPEADELRFSLEAEAHVMAITSLKARHELADRLVTLRARRPELLQDPAAAPLLTILAIELSETDGTASDAAACARRAFAGGRLHSRPGPILAIGTGALVSAGHILEAQGILDEEISDAGSRGAIMEMHGPLATRARARNLVGSAAQAEADARASLEVSPMDPDPVRALKLAGLVDAMIARGAVSDAERLLAGGELARTDSDTILFQGLRVAHARVVELLGRPQEALEELNAVREWARAWGCVNSGWIAWRPPAALLYRALGEHEHASALAAE